MKKIQGIKIVVFILGLFVVFPTTVFSDTEEIAETEGEIEEIQDKLEEEQKDAEKLEQEIGTLQNSLSVTQSNINQTQQALEKAETSIEKTTQKITELDEKIAFQKALLASIVETFYYSSEYAVLALIVDTTEVSGMQVSSEALMQVGGEMQTLIDDIATLRQEARQEKESLEEEKQNKEELLTLQAQQKKSLEANKNSVEGKLNKKAATIEELKSELSELKNDLNKLLGKNYDTNDIEEAAEFASDRTGVRKDFIMGMLVVESNLGRYTGGCTYDEVKDGAKKAYKDGRLSKNSYEWMEYRKDIFEEIVDELGYDEDEVKVSCNPSSYVGTGGAMGIAQFMSDTWRGYQSSIASTTGNNPPDPWSLVDGVSAMALKLAKVPGVTNHKESAECDAAKLYLSGTTSSKYDWYCEKVLYWADNYEDKL